MVFSGFTGSKDSITWETESAAATCSTRASVKHSRLTRSDTDMMENLKSSRSNLDVCSSKTTRSGCSYITKINDVASEENIGRPFAKGYNCKPNGAETDKGCKPSGTVTKRGTEMSCTEREGIGKTSGTFTEKSGETSEKATKRGFKTSGIITERGSKPSCVGKASGTSAKKGGKESGTGTERGDETNGVATEIGGESSGMTTERGIKTSGTATENASCGDFEPDRFGSHESAEMDINPESAETGLRLDLFSPCYINKEEPTPAFTRSGVDSGENVSGQ